MPAAAGVIDGRRDGRDQVWAFDAGRLAEARRLIDLIARDWDSAVARLKARVENG